MVSIEYSLGRSASWKGGPGNGTPLSTTKSAQTLPIPPCASLLMDSSIQQWLNEIKFPYFPLGKAEVLAERLIFLLFFLLLSDPWKKAGKLCRSVTMAYFHVLVHFNN